MLGLQLRWSITAMAMTKRNTVDNEIPTNKEFCSHIKKVYFQLKNIYLQRKRFCLQRKKVCLHTQNKPMENSHGKFSLQIATAYSSGKFPRQKATANSYGKFLRQITMANNHYRYMQRSANNVPFNTSYNKKEVSCFKF